MSLQAVFDNFALLTEAPNSADKLRGLILHLAVSGKLATQNPSDTSARVLVDSIKREAAKKLASPQTKNRSELDGITDEVLQDLEQSIAIRPDVGKISRNLVPKLEGGFRHRRPMNFQRIGHELHDRDAVRNGG